MNKRSLLFVLTYVLWMGMTLAVGAESLRPQDTDRLKAVRSLLADVEPKSLAQMRTEIELSDDPLMQLEIKEAMARAYSEIVEEQQIRGEGRKKWLYSMVALNMAYFQFGGSKDSASGTTNLNKLIRQKLKKYLPAGIFKRPGFHVSVE